MGLQTILSKGYNASGGFLELERGDEKGSEPGNWVTNKLKAQG